MQAAGSVRDGIWSFAGDVQAGEQSCQFRGMAHQALPGQDRQLSFVREKQSDQQKEREPQNAAGKLRAADTEKTGCKHKSFYALLKAKKAGAYTEEK